LWQASEPPENKVNVRIDVSKKQFHVEDSVEMRLEVTNVGRYPLLVPNQASFFVDAAEAYLDVELSNEEGRLYPHMGWAVARIPRDWPTRQSPMETVMNSFLLLPPGVSVVQRIPLDLFLGANKHEVKAGTYKLKCYYSSGGLFDPPAYLRLTQDDIKSLPFQAWHGKIATNELSFVILPAGAKQ
jgi:hypothetical protein